MRSSIITFLFLLTATFAFGQGKASISGIIMDANNNEPIPFATIIVENTGTGTTSDIDGNFTLTNIDPGFVNLVVSYIGYNTKISQDVNVTSTNAPFVEIKLEPSQTLLDEVVVTVDRFEKRSEAPISMQSIGLKEIESNPGSNRDISRVIQSFPGVGSTPAFRNDVLIRGGGPSENRFFLDGIEIPVLNHFSTQGASGGPVGIINADFIQSVDFYSGSFPAAKYNALSGVLDFTQKEGSKDRTNVQAALGASESSFTLDGPIGDKTSYIFSIRRSYLQFLFQALELPFLPTFNDYQVKVKTNFDTKNQLTIISLGSLDRLSLNENIENPDPSQEFILTQIPINNQWSYTIGANYKRFFDKGFHTFILSRNMLNNEFYKYPDNDETRPRSFDYNSEEIENKFRYELTVNESEIKYTISANLERAKYFNNTSQQLFVNDSLVNFDYNSSLGLIKYGLSAQASKQFFNNRFLVSLGFRADANNFNDEMNNLLKQMSPRLALSYSITDKAKINGGIGRYFQLPAYTTLGIRNAEGQLSNLESARYIGANHFNLGTEYRFSKAVLLSVEGFYKDYFQYPIDLITGASLANEGAQYSSVAGATPATFTGSGRAAGFEVLNRIKLKKFSLLASYTFFKSEFTNLEDEYIASSWDSRHLLSLTGTKDFKNNWRAGFKWRFVGGLPFTPFDLETSANILAWNARGQAYPDFNQLNSQRISPFHQLDLRVDKNFFFKRWSLMLYVDIQNVYNFQSESQDFVIREKNEDGTYKTTNNGQDYVLQSIPNMSGTVLPTIGIMIKL